MVFNDSGELIGVVREHIQCDDNNVLVAKEVKPDAADDEIFLDEQAKEDDAEIELISDLPDNSTSLLKRMYALSKKQEEATAK